MNETRNTIQVRDASAHDAPIVAEFNRLLALESEDKVLDEAVLHAGVQEALRRPELCRYFMAEIDGEVVGQTMITYEWTDWRNAVFWWIQSVYVKPTARRRGVFRTLHDHIEALAKRTPQVCGLRLYVDQTNTRAIETYENLGMIEGGYLLYENDWSGAITKAPPK